MVLYITFYCSFYLCFTLVTVILNHYRYVQFILITTGVYASRMWTMAIAATLLYLTSCSLNFVKNMQKWFFPVGWGYVKK